MANNKYERLFEEFPGVSTEAWEAVINTDLKGADYQKKLVWRTAEGFNVRPYYRAEDLQNIEWLGTTAGEFPYVRGVKNCNKWKVFQTINVECPAEANKKALHALESGAESVAFEICNEVDKEFVSALTAGIDPTKNEIVFYICTSNTTIVEPVMEWAAGFDKEAVRIAFDFDPLMWGLTRFGKFCCGKERGEDCFDKIAGYISRYSEEFKHVRFAGVDGSLIGNSGSTIVEELGYMMAAGHEMLVELIKRGVSATAAAKSIRFTTSITSNYFMEIAKLRAARLLWANIMKAYEPECKCAEKIYIHAVTSMWNQTVYDSYVNMLRGTTEAMSAAIAGVHSLEVLPFNAATTKNDEFAERIARNVQLLLKNEAHFDNVVDPAGGSYFIENLTASIAQEAWKLFLEVENEGGYIASFNKGTISARVKASAEKKNKEVATRRITLLGTNQFPNFGEVLEGQKAECACGCNCEVGENALVPYRGGEQFEAMRQAVDASGKAPKAFMLTCGNLAMARARAQFSCNFFACAGIKVQDNTFFASVEEGVKAAKEAGADIVVVCSSDDDYATLAPEVAKLVGEEAIVVVAGAPACAEELKAQGITHFISIRDNVLETLKGYLKELGI
ncbi:MAG: acyl-CoA mutase large subunit family protein [Tidjanibacter sp.]|nr:acyl-CoA mutase large subunit family protein [Tidjanibacter sp.]